MNDVWTQHACSVTLSRVRETNVAVEKRYVFICVCVCVCACARSLVGAWVGNQARGRVHLRVRL
jgi:hypothetical protein